MTTVAYHPAGRELHLRNLQWALRAIEHQITVFTFKGYPTDSLCGERYVVVDPIPDRGHYDFHGCLLPDLIRASPADVFLFMQQDVLFIRTIGELRPDTVVDDAACHCSYFAVHNLDGEWIYPRLWEGGLFLPMKLLRSALDDVSFGYSYKWALEAPRQWMSSVAFTHCNDAVIPIWEYIHNRPKECIGGDKMVDLTLYSAFKNFPFSLTDGFKVHLTGPEHTHQRHPAAYEGPHRLWELIDHTVPRVRPANVPTAALMFLLAGVYEPSEELGSLLRHFRGQRYFNRLLRHIDLLMERAPEWMTPRQLETLVWARAELLEEGIVREIVSH